MFCLARVACGLYNDEHPALLLGALIMYITKELTHEKTGDRNDRRNGTDNRLQ